MSVAGVRGSGPQRLPAPGSRWVGGRRAQLSDLTPTLALAPPPWSSGRTHGLDSGPTSPQRGSAREGGVARFKRSHVSCRPGPGTPRLSAGQPHRDGAHTAHPRP